jgi:RNA polymerase-binding transcription factor DksA
MALSQKDIEKYRQLLEEKRAQIEKQVVGLRKKIKKSLDEDRVFERNSGDPDSDFITESSEIEKDEMLVHQLESAVEQIDDAVEAINEGYFGICQKCGCSIDKGRLNTIPWAKYCYKCQVELEDVEKGVA